MNRLQKTWRALLQKPGFQRLWQFVKFSVVGCGNTLVSLAVYQLCVHLLGLHYLLSNLLAFLISVTNAYYWNNRCVFGDGRKKSGKEHLAGYARSLAAYGGTFLLDSALLFFWVEVCGTGETLAPFLNLLFTVPLNFLVNKYWTFRRRGGERPDQRR